MPIIPGHDRPLDSVNTVIDGIRMLRAECERIGRNPDSLMIPVPIGPAKRSDGSVDVKETVEWMSRLMDEGIKHMNLRLPWFARNRREAEETLHSFATEVGAAFGGVTLG
jgi:hypothetical protein